MPLLRVLAAVLLQLELAAGAITGISGSVLPNAETNTAVTGMGASFTIASEIIDTNEVHLEFQGVHSYFNTGGTITATLSSPTPIVGAIFPVTISNARKIVITISKSSGLGYVASSGLNGALTFSLTGTGLASLPAAAGNAVVVLETKNGGAQIETGSGSLFAVTVPAVPFVGGDPVARHKGKTLQFELPANNLTTLVEAPEFHIRGSVFEGQGPWEQWFDRIVLTNPADDRFLQIRVIKGLDERNYTRIPREVFRTLDVTMGYGPHEQPQVLHKLETYNAQVPDGLLGYRVGFRRVHRHHNLQTSSIGSFPRECVELAGPDLHFYVCSAPAEEYFGDQRHLALRFAHLDLAFMETRDPSVLGGLLPELWGMREMSEATRATVKHEAKAAPAAPGSIADWAGAGGPGMENLTFDCLEPTPMEMKV